MSSSQDVSHLAQQSRRGGLGRSGQYVEARGGDRAEWIARLWCAKEAAAKATGLALIAGPSSVEATSADEGGTIEVKVGPELAARCPDLGPGPISVRTERKGDYVWAWTQQVHSGGRPRARRPGLADSSGWDSAGDAQADLHPQFSEADA